MMSKLQNIKYAPPPPELPVYGQVDPAAVSFFGRTNYAAALEEKKFIFGIRREDRNRHMYVIGKSGVGKSKLFELLARQDIAFDKGLCFMDPHGEVISNLIEFIPEKRIKDVVFIDASDESFPVSFNPLADVSQAMKHQLAQGMVGAMAKQFGQNWSPSLEHLFRFTILALLDQPVATLRDVMNMLSDEGFRLAAIGNIKDDMVRRFWSADFASWSKEYDAEAIIPLVNKMGQLFSDPIFRNIFSQSENRIDFSKFVSDKKIVLVNLGRGRMGESSFSFFGSMLLMKLRQAGIERTSLPLAERPDFYVYIDDFHAIATEEFLQILSESKKYGFCLSLTNQMLSQMAPEMQMSVLGSVGTLVVFRVGGEDAFRLKAEMEPVFDAKDMINLGSQEFYIKMMISGEMYDPFSAESLKVLPVPHRSYKEEIVAFSRKAFAIPRQAIHINP